MGVRRTQNRSLELYVRSAAIPTALFRSLQPPTPPIRLEGNNANTLKKDWRDTMLNLVHKHLYDRLRYDIL